MKKLFFIAAIAGAALVSCTKNELAPSVTEQEEISFDNPVLSVVTKAATEIADNFPTTKDFAVFAHHYAGGAYTNLAGGTLYMNNVQVTYDGSKGTNGSWGSSPAYYWPKKGSLTFAAYAPYMSTGVSYGATGIHFDDYKIASSADNQVDLLFSERAYDKTNVDQKASNPYYYGVQINFLHALSSIQFKVAMDSDLAASTADYQIVVTGINVLGAYSQGDFSQKLTDGSGNTTPPAATGDWSDYKTPETYAAYSNATGISLTNATPISTVTGANKTNLILLPQPLKHGSASDDSDEVKVQVTYKISHSGMESGTYIEETATVSLDSTSLGEWLRGKRYIYTLTIGLEEIRFSPEVADWDDYEPKPGATL